MHLATKVLQTGSEYLPLINFGVLLLLLALVLVTMKHRKPSASKHSEPHCNVKERPTRLHQVVSGVGGHLSRLTNILLFGILIYLLGGRGIDYASSPDWKASDLVVVLLTATAVILAAIGIIIAVGAVIGYQTLSDKAEEKAEKISNEFLGSPRFSDSMKSLIRENIDELRAQQNLQVSSSPSSEDNSHGGNSSVWRDE